MFDGTTPLRGHPRPLTHLGLPHNVKITAAFVWAQDSNTYFFSDNGYWRFNESLGRVDHKHPKPLSEWPGLPDKVDAAVQWNDGKCLIPIIFSSNIMEDCKTLMTNFSFQEHTSSKNFCSGNLDLREQ